MDFWFLFLDGVGLGPNDPNRNPFAQADVPNLQNILHGKRLTSEAINSGCRLPGVSIMAVMTAGIPAKTTADLSIGQAICVDFTGQSRHDHLKITAIPRSSLASRFFSGVISVFSIS